MRNSGFTLIELIAVLLILALLSAATTAGLATAREKAWRTQAHETCRSICGAWNSYLFDVRKFPKDVKNGKHEATYANLKWLVDPSENKVQRVYLEMSEEEKDKEKKNGLRDHWGQVLYFSLDTDYDGEVENPYPDTDAEGSPLSFAKIKASAIAWSMGNPRIKTENKPANAVVAWQ